jgi:hypothetical protein
MITILELYEVDKRHIMAAQENEFSKGNISICEQLYSVIVKIDNNIKKLKKYQKEGFKFMTNEK